MSLDLDINSLTVVAPVDVANPFCSCIVFDTGHLMLSSDLKTRKDSAEVTDLFFDCYRLKIEDIHSYSSPEYAKWRNVQYRTLEDSVLTWNRLSMIIICFQTLTSR